MEMRCTPAILSGKIKAISSKSHAHRVLICSALANEPTKINCNVLSKDITATLECLKMLGADIKTEENTIFVNPQKFNEKAEIDCGESGSTLRFLLPLVSALRIDTTINAHGRLPERPLSPLKEELEKKGVVFHKNNEYPLHITGNLQSGDFELAGNISSQFISGLLFALPLLKGDSKIRLIPPVESKPYIDMTVATLRDFGILIEETENTYIIKGNQKYISPKEITIEGDWSNSAFFLCAGALSKDGVTVSGLDINSTQGDKKILDILKRMGASVEINGDEITVKKNKLMGTMVNGGDIPDLVPVVSVMGAMCDKGVTHIVNASRLRLKESDRIATTESLLSKVGAAVSETDDGLVIWGENDLIGGRVDGANDHRIVMSAAVFSSLCALPVDIVGAEAVSKSYPHFFEDFNSLGGKANVINDGK
ncbi:MAG: 3-phosphoshikimate 1-carboxyvinyltransferase [Clostridia bacterium]|nr:3-phosphoshikimate 1-carboxyvinyltransferase [Clostridia bacterium]